MSYRPDAELLAFAQDRLRYCVTEAMNVFKPEGNQEQLYENNRGYAQQWATIVLAFQSMIKPAIPSPPPKRHRKLQLDEVE